MLASEGVRSTDLRGQVFIRDRHRVLPFGPLLRDYSVTPAEADALLAALGGWWVQWTRGSGSGPHGWYAVICRTFTPVEQLPSSNVRSKLRRGLKRCRVSRVPIDTFIEQGFEVYDAAVRGYERSSATIVTREAFRATIERERGFGDFREYWMVSIDDRPAAYAKTILHDRTEVDYTAIKFDPEQLKHYPSYALIHEMNRYYLDEAKYAYVSDGQRSILHDTTFQEFLVRDLLFEQHPLELHIHYARGIGLGMKLARLARGPLARRSSSARAMLELDRFATVE